MRWKNPFASPQSPPVETTRDDIGQHQSEPVDTDLHQSAPIETDADQVEPLIFAALRTPVEHASKLLERMHELEVYGCSIHQGELESIHKEICVELGWVPRKWASVGRELK